MFFCLFLLIFKYLSGNISGHLLTTSKTCQPVRQPMEIGPLHSLLVPQSTLTVAEIVLWSALLLFYSKPMMDLLIFLCAQYHLNPSSYTIDLLSAEKNPIKFKPNTPIGMLEVEKVILRPKVLDKKKPTPIIPEVRISLYILISYG